MNDSRWHAVPGGSIASAMPYGLPGFRKKEHNGSLAEDVRDFVASRGRGLNWKVVGISVGLTSVIIGGFLYFSQFTIPYRAPKPIFPENWSAKRSTADMLAEHKRDWPAMQAKMKAEAEAEAKRQADLKAIADALGISDE